MLSSSTTGGDSTGVESRASTEAAGSSKALKSKSSLLFTSSTGISVMLSVRFCNSSVVSVVSPSMESEVN